MAATLIDSTQLAVTASPGAIAAPAGITAGDEIYVVLHGRVTPGTVTPPAGFTQVGATMGNSFSSVWVKTAGSSEPSTYSFSWTGVSSRYQMVALLVRGSAGAAWTKTDVFAGSPSSSWTCPSKTSGQIGDLPIRMALGATISSTPPGGPAVTWPAGATAAKTVTHTDGTFASVASQAALSAAGTVPALSGVAITSVSDSAAQNAYGTAVTLVIAAAASTPPANTVAPAVTGTAAVGSLLTTSNGTWSGSPTGYTYQWQRDGTNISGATGSTYTLVSADAGHTIRCVVTATNAAGSTAANSNGVAIPATPVNTAAPTITFDGTTFTLTDQGTWTGTGITYTRQWYRGIAPLTGETGTTYTKVTSDEGANITCHVIATNGGGSSPDAVSNIIVPPVTAPLGNASGLWYYSGGTANTDPGLSIGGVRGGTIPDNTVSNIFGPIPGTLAQAGGHLYSIVYVRNTHTTTTDPATRLIVADQPDNPGLHIDVAVPDETINTPVGVLASSTTPPTGLTFARPSDFAGGLVFGDLPAGAYRGVVVRLTIDPGTAPGDDSFALRVRSETA